MENLKDLVVEDPVSETFSVLVPEAFRVLLPVNFRGLVPVNFRELVPEILGVPLPVPETFRVLVPVNGKYPFRDLVPKNLQK